MVADTGNFGAVPRYGHGRIGNTYTVATRQACGKRCGHIVRKQMLSTQKRQAQRVECHALKKLSNSFCLSSVHV